MRSRARAPLLFRRDYLEESETGIGLVEDAVPQVVHNVGGARFELVVNGQTGHLDYQLAGDRLRLIHIEVPPEIQGHHYADALARAGLEYARREHLRVVPICPFVRSFLTRHPEYLSLIDEHWIPILK